MAEKNIKKTKSEKKPEPTVQHESSADSAQDLGIRENEESTKQEANASSHRRKHGGSDGADQERGSNH